MKPIIVLPVIHHRDLRYTLFNAAMARAAGCPGVFVISMSGADAEVPAAACAIKKEWPQGVVGINLLNSWSPDALKISLANNLDMTWTDNCGVKSGSIDDEARYVQRLMSGRPDHSFFCGVAFKYIQPAEPDPPGAAFNALSIGLIPTTSGSATGVAAPVDKLRAMRAAIGPNKPLAVASGITPDNIGDYRGLITHALVATGVSVDEHTFDPRLLEALMRASLAVSDGAVPA